MSVLLRAQFDWQAGVVAIVGAVASLVSVGSDIKNNQLVHLGEEALRRVERDRLISDSEELPEYAILTLDNCQERPSEMHKRILKHKVLFRSIESVVGTVFLVAAVYSICVAVT